MLGARFCDFYVRSHFFALFLAFASRESVLDVRVGGYNFGAILVGPICLGCNTKNAHPGPYFSDQQPCGVPTLPALRRSLNFLSITGAGEMVGLVGAGLWPHVTVRAREGAGVGVLM